ncbi:hypothetical protein [Halobaculum magnesiiphilum]|uniref:Uncharacterized protein n=1 Tax=Halobaculum magnesiiphilum TaxID=1017351 RepID=A0A8T8WEW8_9EURY|nr:hypothetical protein [Halobaculum magnesiiphilum]QZP38336.1 hypothetical protein K6T50_04105 [Halobaculum magnesiiphilum]
MLAHPAADGAVALPTDERSADATATIVAAGRLPPEEQVIELETVRLSSR